MVCRPGSHTFPTGISFDHNHDEDLKYTLSVGGELFPSGIAFLQKLKKIYVVPIVAQRKQI